MPRISKTDRNMIEAIASRAVGIFRGEYEQTRIFSTLLIVHGGICPLRLVALARRRVMAARSSSAPRTSTRTNTVICRRKTSGWPKRCGRSDVHTLSRPIYILRAGDGFAVKAYRGFGPPPTYREFNTHAEASEFAQAKLMTKFYAKSCVIDETQVQR